MDPIKRRTAIGKLTLFFGLAYLMQGVSQDSGLINQPLMNYLLHELKWDEDRAAKHLSVIIIPWLIKPVYGLVSDLVPIFGRHRLPYLYFTCLSAAAAFLVASGVKEPFALVWVLVLTAVSVAITDVVTDAFMVAEGQRYNRVRQFQGVQWTWVNLAGVASALGGGWLAGQMSAWSALQTALVISAVGPVALLLGSIFLVSEPKAKTKPTFQEAVEPLVDGFRSTKIWLAAGFIFLWNCTPNFGFPLYSHQSDKLHFSQEFIGHLTAIGSVTAAFGAWAFERFLTNRFSTRTLIIWSIWLGTASTLSYLFMIDQVTAVVITAISGAIGMVFTLVMLGLAGEACPARGAGFWFAALMSVSNGSTRVSTILGSSLYVSMNKDITPLIWVSGLTTLVLFAGLPLVSRIVPDETRVGDASLNPDEPG